MTIKDAQFITVSKDKLTYRKAITILKESNISKEFFQLCVELITASHDSNRFTLRNIYDGLVLILGRSML